MVIIEYLTKNLTLLWLVNGALFASQPLKALDSPSAQRRIELATSSFEQPSADAPSKEQIAFFEKKIRPILAAECYQCHSEAVDKKRSGGLALDTQLGIQTGGDSGPLFNAKNPKSSVILKALKHQDPKSAMPHKTKLDDHVVNDFERWISMGAPVPFQAINESNQNKTRLLQHWSFQKVTRPKIDNSATNPSNWPLDPLDRIILATLNNNQLTTSPDSDRRTWLRRVSFDLIGLPPTLKEVRDFENDRSSDAFEKVVDRLLSSPSFGEKWAKHWLDVARFGESTGKTVNFAYPHAWRYRDYVIAAFNSDKPYDQFIWEQLAGDLMESPDVKTKTERQIATGFLAIGPKTLNERSGLKFELDQVDEQIDVTTQAFLGITVACARCHDHKSDPITTEDYYAIAGIFRSTETCYGTVRFINAQRPSMLLSLSPESSPSSGVEKLTDADRQRIESQIQTLRASLKNNSDPMRLFFSNGQLSLLQAKLDAFDRDGNPKFLAMGVRDKPTGNEPKPLRDRLAGPGGFTNNGTRFIADSVVFRRGESDQPGDRKIPRRAPAAIGGDQLNIPPGTSGRLELAKWIASKDNPLTARVMTNRIWQQLFGKGLVPTPDDFGTSGRPPSHPELLDYLASEFVIQRWSIKKLIRKIALSRTYRQASIHNNTAQEIDPDNGYVWRVSPRRLDAEIIRDAMLFTSGQLSSGPPKEHLVAKMGEGPVNQLRPLIGNLNSSINDSRENHRSVYLPTIRDNLPESLALFDAADPSLIVPERGKTTVPSQSLYLLNNGFVERNAEATANLVIKSAIGDAERITTIYETLFARKPTIAESKKCESFLKKYRQQLKLDNLAVRKQESETWSALCIALYSTAEFLFNN